jgi:DNA end-binding protein Ku
MAADAAFTVGPVNDRGAPRVQLPNCWKGIFPMAARPTWQGHLRLSLVSCPVALYTATARGGEVNFNMLHKQTHNRIHMIPTDPETGPVDHDDIVKGYEIEKDHYVVVTEDEIEGVRLESSHTIDIDRFVDEKDIDRLYWNDPYFLVPDGKMAAEAYTVIREAMRKAGRIALGRVVMHTRERLLAIEPRDKAFADIPATRPDPKMVAIAAKIIEQQEGPFEPAKFNDRYEDALRALIKQKEKGAGRPVTAEEPKSAEVIDLMQALRKSLGAKGRAAGAKKPARKSAAHPRKRTTKRA